MKRLKITLLVFFILLAVSLVAFANEVNKKRRSFFDHPFFQDSTLESAVEHFQNSMSDFSSFSQVMFRTEWQQDNNGRTIYINPSDKNQKLDVKIENGLIQIKSAEEKKSEHMHSQSISSQMMNVPQDCDSTAAEISQLDDGLKIFFPFKKATKEINPERVPITPADGAIDI